MGSDLSRGDEPGTDPDRDAQQVPRRDRKDMLMQGWLMWGLILPILLVVAGIVTLRRKKNRR
jgi:hypothetical protein